MIGEAQYLNDSTLPDNALAGRFVPIERVAQFEFVVGPQLLRPEVKPESAAKGIGVVGKNVVSAGDPGHRSLRWTCRRTSKLSRTAVDGERPPPTGDSHQSDDPTATENWSRLGWNARLGRPSYRFLATCESSNARVSLLGSAARDARAGTHCPTPG
jgi:hypothetical protein